MEGECFADGTRVLSLMMYQPYWAHCSSAMRTLIDPCVNTFGAFAFFYLWSYARHMLMRSATLNTGCGPGNLT